MYAKPLGQRIDPVCLGLQRLKDLRLALDPPLDVVPGKDILPHDILLLLLVQDHPHAEHPVREEAGPARARAEVHDVKVLRQELDLREAVARDPAALGAEPGLVDPDLLARVGELGDAVSDQPHLGGGDGWGDPVLCEQQRARRAKRAEADVNL